MGNLLYNVISETLQDLPILRYFNRQLYNSCFMPDINGYVLVYLQPPHLSGYSLDPDIGNFLGDISQMSPFLAIDVGPPNIQVSVAEVSGTFGGIPYGTKVSESNQLNITYVDSSKIEMFSMHKLWVDYIRQVTIGEVDPQDAYMGSGGTIAGVSLQPGWCYIDYLASCYIVKFRPSLIGDSLENNIVFISKAVGIFPINLPDKELIGRRDSNELTVLPFTYNCASYRQCIFSNGVADTEYSWIIDEFNSLASQYS